MIRFCRALLLPSVFVIGNILSAEDTLPALIDGVAPESFDELWSGFDPRVEPLDVEILKEWEEDGVVLQVLRYRVGVFKGEKAMIAAVYGYPKGGSNIPGLVQAHGGGQYAHSNAVLTNAKRGYATISISWAGRIDAPDYKVTPAEVALFFEDETSDPEYKLTTDWGALDGYHAPYRYPGGNSMGVNPTEWTLDSVESPRNAPYFLWTLAARRALTFLERQEVVDGERLGIYGHSMGGKITVLTAGSDSRVKAAAPSCGGISNTTDSESYQGTLADAVYLKRIRCPIMFLSPSNDFHGRIDDLQQAFKLIQTDEWRATCSPHHNHQDTKNYEVATQLWFDQHLKGIFEIPETPKTNLDLKNSGGIPVFTVRPDDPESVLYVDIYYTQHGQIDGKKNDRENTKARFWHYSKAERKGGKWIGEIPVLDADKPLWVYANVVYPLDETISGAGYYYGDYSTEQFNLSSRMAMILPEDLKASGVKVELSPSLVIETFDGDWEKEWYTYRPKEWGRQTHKVYDERWKAPNGAKLALKVLSEEANQLVVGLDNCAAVVDLKGGSQWELVELSLKDFKDADEVALDSFDGIRNLSLSAMETLKGGGNTRLVVGAKWKGADPVFRDLLWIEQN